MTQIQRRKVTVKLYPGNYEAELADLLDRAMAASRAEESGGPQRAGGKSQSMSLAQQYDKKAAQAEADGIEVVIHEISNTAWQKLADDHPPRENNERDELMGLNLATFPAALLRAAVGATDLDLGEMSRAHYMKLERAAWNLHNGEDEIPKESLVSMLNRARDGDSKSGSDTE